MWWSCLLLALQPSFETAWLEARLLESPVDQIRHKRHGTAVRRDVESSAAVEVEDVLHVLVAVVEEHLVLRRVALVTVSQGLPLTFTLGETTQARIWDLVEDRVKTDFIIWRIWNMEN